MRYSTLKLRATAKFVVRCTELLQDLIDRPLSSSAHQRIYSGTLEVVPSLSVLGNPSLVLRRNFDLRTTYCNRHHCIVYCCGLRFDTVSVATRPSCNFLSCILVLFGLPPPEAAQKLRVGSQVGLGTTEISLFSSALAGTATTVAPVHHHCSAQIEAATVPPRL